MASTEPSADPICAARHRVPQAQELTTFALVFFAIGTGFQLLVYITTSRYRRVETDKDATHSTRKASFATEITRLAGVVGAVIGFAYMSPIHEWDVAFINPLIMMISLAVGLSIVPAALSHTGVLTRSALAENLNFSPADRDNPEAVKAPGPTRTGGTFNPSATAHAHDEKI